MQEVVAAVVIQGDKVLIAQRADGHIKGKWEFPGGKVRPGESPRAALEREILEELNIRIEVGEKIGAVDFSVGRKPYRLLAFASVYLDGDFRLKDHSQLDWVTVEALLTVDLAPPDVPIAEQLAQPPIRTRLLGSEGNPVNEEV